MDPGESGREPPGPVLYEIATRDWLGRLSRASGRRATFDDVPDGELDRIAGLGFDWVWLLGVWRTGAVGRRVSLAQPDWRRHYLEVLPNFSDADVCGSPYAVQGYSVHADFGGDPALARLRARLRDRGIRLMLDFVPNHSARDHPWVRSHPEFYIRATEVDLARDPANYAGAETDRGGAVLAFGRDPYFPGWPDTFQLNYRHPALREAMRGELARVSAMCDGVRCDMAMLVLPDVFARTWGDAALPVDGTPPDDSPFWPGAIARVRAEHPEFLFLAEAYWDLEWTLQQQGFDLTYDKRLYDRLRDRDARAVRDHLRADPQFQRRSARFLENHDEPRAASAFPREVHPAAATVAFLVPGLRLFHEGQLEGHAIRGSVHLARRAVEPADPALADVYARLLDLLKRPEARRGAWALHDCRPAWDGNPTWEHFLAFTRDDPDAGRLLVAVNYGPTRGQCYVDLSGAGLAGASWTLRDRLGPFEYQRDGDDLGRRGLYLDMPAWGHHAFEVVRAESSVLR